MLVRWVGPVSHKPVRFGKINFLKYLISSRYEKELEIEVADFQRKRHTNESGVITKSFFSNQSSNHKQDKSGITLLDSGLPLELVEKIVKTNPNRAKIVVNDRRGDFARGSILSYLDGIVTYSYDSYTQYSFALSSEKVLFLKPSIDPSIYYPSNEKKVFDLICLINISGKQKRKEAIDELTKKIECLNLKAAIVCKRKEVDTTDYRSKNVKLITSKDKELAGFLRKSSAAFVLCNGSENCLTPIGLLKAGACGTAVISNYNPGNQPGITPGSHYFWIQKIDELAEGCKALKNDGAKTRFMIESILRHINKNHTNWHRSNELYNFLKTMEQEDAGNRISASM